MTSNAAFEMMQRSLINYNNLRVATQEHDVRQAEAAYDAIKADPGHDYAQISDARLRMADARLALWRAERTVGNDVFPDAQRREKMYKR